MLMAKKKKVKGKKKAVSKNAKKKPAKKQAKKAPKKKAKPARKSKAARPMPPARVEALLEKEFKGGSRELFCPINGGTFGTCVKRYSPVLITLMIGLATYLYLVFFLFYPTTIVQGHYIQLLIFVMFIFLLAGLLIYLGLRAELLFVRVLSFIFVFVIFTFLLLFILLAYIMQTGMMG